MRSGLSAVLVVIASAALGCGDDGGGASDSGGATEGSTGTPTEGTSSPTTEPTTSATSTDPSGETSEGSSCEAAGFRCVAAPPGGWNGPVARLTEDDPDDGYCGGAFPTSVASGFTDVGGVDPTCSCSCADAEGGTCAGTISASVYDASCEPGGCNENYDSCASVDSTYDLGIELFMDFTGDGIRVQPEAPEVTRSPTCAAVENHDIPEPQPSGYIEACAAEAVSEEACGAGDVCTESPNAPFSSVLCIWTEGDTACPNGEYFEREVLYSSVDDGRACSACECGAAQNVICDGDITVRADYPNEAGMSIMDPPETYPANGDCTGRVTPNGTPGAPLVNFVIDYVEGSPTPMSTGCSPTGGEPTGEATGTDPITLCCTVPP
jgi:hypothetical protein